MSRPGLRKNYLTATPYSLPLGLAELLLVLRPSGVNVLVDECTCRAEWTASGLPTPWDDPAVESEPPA